MKRERITTMEMVAEERIREHKEGKIKTQCKDSIKQNEAQRRGKSNNCFILLQSVTGVRHFYSTR